MINEEFLLNFRTRSQVRLSTLEREKFEQAVGYSEDMSGQQLVKLYEDIHAFYDITMDEMEEDDAIGMMPTYQLVMKMMRKRWFHIK